MNDIQLFSDTALYFRKTSDGKPFDRESAMKPLLDKTSAYWGGGVHALVSFCGKHEVWDKLQRHCQRNLATAQFAKALSQEDRSFLAELLVNFGYYSDVQTAASALITATSFATFEEAAKYALEQIGVKGVDFELRNEQIRQALLDRTQAAIFATRNNIESTFDTIIEEFYDLGHHPYSDKFISALQTNLLDKTDWEAKRFALTETGIASELAQINTYRRNGVQQKRWNALNENTRESHAALDGVEIGINQEFNVGGNEADHPLDPDLPADELVNCHCWLSPVVNDDFQLDPAKIWEGE